MVGRVSTGTGTARAGCGRRLSEAVASRRLAVHDMTDRPIDRKRGDTGALASRSPGLTLKLEFKARWLWVALLLLLSVWIIHSFLVPLAWASIIAVATWPIYRGFASRMPPSMALSATPLVFTILVSSSILGPMVFAFGAVTVEAHNWLDKLALADKTGLAAPVWLESLPLVGSRLAERWQVQLGAPGGLSVWLQRADSSSLLSWVQTLGQFAAYHLFVVLFTILVLFFVYRGGDKQALRVNRFLRTAIGDGAAPYLELATQAVRATIIGMVAVALFDGVLTGIIYAVAGVEHAAVWGAVTALFAMIPYLGYVAVSGVALSLAASGAVVPALAVCVLGGFVHFVADKIVRPMLVGDAVKLGFVWVLIASLGGLEVLGLLGVLIGPVVLALASSILHQRRQDSPASPERLAAPLN